MPTYTRDDQIDIRVTLDGVPYGASWDSISGGGKTANTVKIRVGGREIDLGGPASRDDVTVGIQMSDIVASWFKTFDNRVGKGVMRVSWSILDSNLNILAGPYTYTGTEGASNATDFDASNTSPGPAKFQVVLKANEDLA